MRPKYKFELVINAEHDAFDGNLFGELSRILGELSDGMACGFVPTRLKDFNGNSVGTVDLTEIP